MGFKNYLVIYIIYSERIFLFHPSSKTFLTFGGWSVRYLDSLAHPVQTPLSSKIKNAPKKRSPPPPKKEIYKIVTFSLRMTFSPGGVPTIQ